MASAVEIILGMLLVLGLPVLLGIVWLVRKNQHRRRAARDLKQGNKIYSQWRQGAANPPRR
jgi:hypothetical protein